MASNVEFTCFVRGLDQDTDGNDLKIMFSKFGNVIDSKIIYDHETGKSRRFGFVSFEEERSMRDAIKEMNDYSKKNIGFQCFVHGLDCDTDAKALENEFSAYGEVIDTRVICDPETGISRGFGFVTFKDAKSMRDAIMLMDGDEIDGAQINVDASYRKYVFIGSITVEVARPRRKNRSIEIALELGRLIEEKEKKQMSGL